MTIQDDIATVKKFLDFNSPMSVYSAWGRIVEALPAPPEPTAAEQFQAFPVGQEFTTQNPETFVFVKTGASSAARFHRHRHSTQYFQNVLEELPTWTNPDYRVKLIPKED